MANEATPLLWKQCPKYPSYEVSNTGFVRRSKTKYLLKFNIKKGTHPYRRVKLSENGISKLVLVHRLVLEAFVGPCPEGQQTLHLDNDPQNNHLKNLKWGTAKENHAAINRHGIKNGRAKLSPEQVYFVRNSNLKNVELAQNLNVSTTTIENIKNKKLWRTLP